MVISCPFDADHSRNLAYAAVKVPQVGMRPSAQSPKDGIQGFPTFSEFEGIVAREYLRGSVRAMSFRQASRSNRDARIFVEMCSVDTRNSE